MGRRTELQCVRVNKVFDWINHFTEIKMKEKMVWSKDDCFKNNICLPFQIRCDGSKSILWNGNEMKEVTGVLSITINQQCRGTVELFINGERMASLTGGQSYSAVISDVELVEVSCFDSNSSKRCQGTLEMQLISVDKQKCDCKKIIGYLSDSKGNPLDPCMPNTIHCEEISDPLHRKSTKIMRQDREKVIVHEVDLLLKGFITVQVMDGEGKVFAKCTFQFGEIETVYLCAPKGTHINSAVSKFDCKVHAFERTTKHDCIDVNIKILLLVSISTTKRVKVDIEAVPCKARTEPMDYCKQKHKACHEAVQTASS